MTTNRPTDLLANASGDLESSYNTRAKVFQWILDYLRKLESLMVGRLVKASGPEFEYKEICRLGRSPSGQGDGGLAASMERKQVARFVSHDKHRQRSKPFLSGSFFRAQWDGYSGDRGFRHWILRLRLRLPGREQEFSRYRISGDQWSVRTDMGDVSRIQDTG